MEKTSFIGVEIFLTIIWILQWEFLFVVKEMIFIYAKNMKNLQNISFCLMLSKKQYNFKSASSKKVWITMKKYIKKIVKTFFIDVQNVKYVSDTIFWFLQLSVTWTSLKLEEFLLHDT